jgi:hypothetical protein
MPRRASEGLLSLLPSVVDALMAYEADLKAYSAMGPSVGDTIKFNTLTNP